MFDDLLRTLKKMEHGLNVTVPLTVDTDSDGYIDRQCPGPDCKFAFKVHENDWRDIVRDEEVFCPFCGKTDESKAWLTDEQSERVRAAAVAQVKDLIGDAMRSDAENWNRRQHRNSFLTIKMEVKGERREVILPASATDPMRLKITCAACRCRYSVIGSAFFCPSCGHNSADHMLHQSLGTIRAALDVLPAIRSGIDDRDTAENTVRILIENGLQNAVTAFQRHAEALFDQHPLRPKARRNAFQNLADGSSLWASAFGNGYEAHLDSAELARLARYFQQRHILAHRDGLVDQDYIDRSGDTAYRVGQRLVIRESTVSECVALVERLATGMAKDMIAT